MRPDRVVPAPTQVTLADDRTSARPSGTRHERTACLRLHGSEFGPEAGTVALPQVVGEVDEPRGSDSHAIGPEGIALVANVHVLPGRGDAVFSDAALSAARAGGHHAPTVRQRTLIGCLFH